ncbi:hypothetical protein LCGC14_2474820 [marine sediment metagenome]|uniref:Uncharacterized protein n=1 Tax=marine sediment metagenome TaxID=412755 RepID=A0A0F9B975_9ZZZZ
MRVYVAHTYGRRHGLTDKECEVNTLKAIGVGRQLILMGHRPFIPNLYHYVHAGWKESPDEDIYFNLVAEWIQFCDALLVAKMPSWEGSGVQREVDIAISLGIPVYYSMEELNG